MAVIAADVALNQHSLYECKIARAHVGVGTRARTVPRVRGAWFSQSHDAANRVARVNDLLPISFTTAVPS